MLPRVPKNSFFAFFFTWMLCKLVFLKGFFDVLGNKYGLKKKFLKVQFYRDQKNKIF